MVRTQRGIDGSPWGPPAAPVAAAGSSLAALPSSPSRAVSPSSKSLAVAAAGPSLAGAAAGPSLAVDVVLLTVRHGALWALLRRRDRPPDLGRWALPAAIVRLDESLDEAASRVLDERIGLANVFIEQLYTFGEPGRDPRGRVVAVAYYALVEPGALERAVATRPDAGLTLARLGVPWQGERGGPVDALDAGGTPLPLAFDHADILGTAVKRIRGKLGYAPIGFELLPADFSLRDLRLVHEAILGRALNKDSFRRRMLDRGLVVPTGRRATGVGHRPPELYRFADASAI